MRPISVGAAQTARRLCKKFWPRQRPRRSGTEDMPIAQDRRLTRMRVRSGHGLRGAGVLGEDVTCWIHSVDRVSIVLTRRPWSRRGETAAVQQLATPVCHARSDLASGGLAPVDLVGEALLGGREDVQLDTGPSEERPYIGVEVDTLQDDADGVVVERPVAPVAPQHPWSRTHSGRELGLLGLAGTAVGVHEHRAHLAPRRRDVQWRVGDEDHLVIGRRPPQAAW